MVRGRVRKRGINLRLARLALRFLTLPRSKRPKVYIVVTESVVGLTCEAGKLGREYLALLKRRDPDKPFAIAVADLKQAKGHEAWSDRCEPALERLGVPVTLICNGVGFRFISPVCKELQEYYRIRPPHYLTSANLSGEPQLSLEQAVALFGRKITGILNLCQPQGRPTKVVDIDRDRVVRE